MVIIMLVIVAHVTSELVTVPCLALRHVQLGWSPPLTQSNSHQYSFTWENTLPDITHPSVALREFGFTPAGAYLSFEAELFNMSVSGSIFNLTLNPSLSIQQFTAQKGFSEQSGPLSELRMEQQ